MPPLETEPGAPPPPTRVGRAFDDLAARGEPGAEDSLRDRSHVRVGLHAQRASAIGQWESGPPPRRTRALPPRAGLSVCAAFMLAWALLVLGLATCLARKQVRMSRLLRDTPPLDPDTLPIDLTKLARCAGLGRTIPLIVTPLVEAPAVWGLLRPRVLLPPGLIDALPPDQLTWVLLHELAHIRRRDAWVVWFQRLVQIAYVFHPAVWVANRLVNVHRELACDDEALARAGEVARRDCGAGFLAVIEWVHTRGPATVPELGLFGTCTLLRRRLMRILDTQRPVQPRLSPRAALLLGVLALILLPYVHAQQPQAGPVERVVNAGAGPKPSPPAADDAPSTFVAGGGFTLARPAPIVCIAYSPDGKRIATGVIPSPGGTDELRVWDLESGLSVFQIGMPMVDFRGIAYSPNGRFLATVGFQGVPRIRDADDGQVLRQFHGHSDKVDLNAVAFSPDGQTLATAGADKTIRLWDVASGAWRKTLTGHRGTINGLAFSPDGKRLAACDQEGATRLWDVVSGEVSVSLVGHVGSIESVAFAPDGTTLATGGSDATVRIWNAATGAVLARIEGRADQLIACVRFSPDGKLLAASSGPKASARAAITGGLTARSVVTLWDVATRRELAALEGHTQAIPSIAFSPDGKTLATGSLDATLRLWDVASYKLKDSLPRPPGAAGTPDVVLALTYSPDGKILATAGETRTIQLRDVASRALLKTFPGHAEAVTSLAFAPDGKTLASSGYDGLIRLWDLASGREPRELKGHKGWVFSVAFSPDGRMVASGGYDKLVKLWDLAGGAEVVSLQGHSGSVRSVAFSPDGRALASGGSDRTVRLWNLAGRKERTVLKGHTGAVRAVAFSPDGTLLASGAEDMTIRVWDAVSGQERATLTGPTDIVTCLAFARDGKTLASAGFDQLVRIWDVAASRERAAVHGHAAAVAALAFAPDGRHIATGGYDTQVKLWDARVATSSQARLVFDVGGGATRFAVYSRDGKTIATGSDDGSVRLWDAATGAEKALLGTFENKPHCGAFSPDGKRVAAGSWALHEGANVWDVDTRAQVAHLDTGARATWSLVFAPDGKSLASSNGDGSIKLWDTTSWTVTLELPRQGAMVRSLAFAPDGKTLASMTVGAGSDPITLWEAGTTRIRAQLLDTPPPLWRMAIGPDGKLLATTCTDRSVSLWDVEAGVRRQSIACEALARSVAFSPDHRWLVIGLTNGDIRFWDLAADRQGPLLQGHQGGVTDLQFAPDGHSLASSSNDGTVRIWDAPAP